MKSLNEIYAKYAGPDCHTGSDKGSVHSYIDVYAQLFESCRLSAKRVLEIGILTGHSLRMWEEYFENAEVHGVDINDHPLDIADLKPMIAEGTHHISLLDATDLGQVNATFGEMSFDVVIEDASHSLEQQLALYSIFGPRVSAGGIYVVEDVDDIDNRWKAFKKIDLEKEVDIIDLRHVKGRFDDVLVVIK